MKIIVVGLGRMGSGLSLNLVKKGHKVTAIDINPEAFKKLGTEFDGEQIVGIGFDRDVLKKAGIDRADAVITCTVSDETNALVARMARNIYRVPRVIARIYDVRKAEIYRRLGIQTISTTSWGIQKATDILSFSQIDSVYEISNGKIRIIRVELPPMLVGRTVNDIATGVEIQVVAISRKTSAIIPTRGTVLEKGDVLYLSVASSSTDKIKEMFGLD